MSKTEFGLQVKGENVKLEIETTNGVCVILDDICYNKGNHMENLANEPF